MAEVLKTNVKIEADASKLKSEVDESTEKLQRLKEELTSVNSQLAQAFKNINKADANQVQALADKKSQLQSIISDINKGVNVDDTAIKNILGDVEEVKQEVDSNPIEIAVETKGTEKVKSRLGQIFDKVKDIGKVWKETFNDSSAAGGIKKVALALVGVGGVFSGIRKAMSTYLSQNEDLQNKINGIWYALGSLMAPVVEWMVNLFAKLVLYLNAFLKGLGLAGINLEKMNKNTAKLKKLISGFDELNIYSSSGSEESATNPFENVEVNTEWIEKLTTLGEKLRPVFEWIKETLTKIFDWISEHIELVVAAIGVIVGIGIIAKIVEVFKTLKTVWDIIKGIFDLIKGSKIVETITAGLGKIWTVIQSIGTFIAGHIATIGGIAAVIGGITLAVTQFVDMWKNGWNIIGEILKDLGIAIAAVGAVLLGAPAAVAAIVAGIVAVVSTLVILIKEHWDEIKLWTENTWNSIKEFLDKLWNGIKQSAITIFTAIGDWFKTFWENLKTFFTNIVTSIKDTVATIWTALSNITNTIFTNIKNILTNIWNSISNFITNIVTNISNSVVNIFTKMKDAIYSVFQGIVNVIKAPINAVIGVINRLISGVVSGINGMTSALNKLSFDVPSWVPLIGGKHFGLNIKQISAPQIPYLAKGGVLDKPTVAMLGEYQNANSNPEIAAPQSLLKDMLVANNSELVGAFAQMTQQIISAINNVDMEVTIGDDTIAKSAQRGNRTYYNMTGKSMFAV